MSLEMPPDFTNNLRYKIPLVIIALIGATLVFYLVSLHGAGTTPDSVYYISVARHIADGTGIIGYDGYYLVLQPPLYPMLLGAIKMIMFTDPLVSAGYVNSILFGLIIYISGLFLLKHLNSYVLVLFGTITVLISFVFIQIALMALSELLFILLILLYLYFFEKYKSDGKLNFLILLSISASLACLTRYIGIILILSGVVSIFIQVNKSIKDKLVHILIFLLITCIPIAMWIIRNFYLSGTFVGQRADSSYTLFENLKFLFNTAIHWYLPAHFNGVEILFITLAALIAIGIILSKRREKFQNVLKEFYPILIFLLLYAGIIVISSTTTAYDHIANRLLSPIYIPLFILSFYICDLVFNRLSKYVNRNILTILFAACLISWMIYPAGKAVYIINDYFKLSGIGFNRDYWENKEIINYLNCNKNLEKKYTFFSNVPEAVYILTNISAHWSPAKTLYNSPQLINSASNLKEAWKGTGKVCLVWFDNINDRQFLYPIEELQKNIHLNKLAEFKDGAVYIVENN
jgi:hypothetical protein